MSTSHDPSTEAAVHAMSGLPEPAPVTSSGVPVGFKAGRTLPVRVELARQLRRRRTQLSLAFMVLLPIILVIAFSVGDDNGGNRSSFVDLAGAGAANFAMVTLFFSTSFLLIVVIALFFGDTIASEASWSSLRYLLAMPVPRIRLLRQKILVAGLLSLIALALLAVSGWLIGLIVYGNGPLTTPIGDTFTGMDSIGRLGLVLCYVVVQLTWVAGLAFFLSVSTDAPLGAVGGAVLLAILSQILNQIDALEDLRNLLPTRYAFSWTGALVDPVRWDDMVRGGFSSLAYAVVFFGLGVLRFRRKDITS
ncbi:ABC transporter permease subunit [Nakamurella sp. YIM 132087]|uniref:ABC transporter permease subunit n=1 Tax=Nakamurella alba TaxID=2665158 RepID=A0A7K1FRL0_9ACTN|nr:ABC transporter permease subunit [Nakamurella alba]MTD16775.1 ABC transporter permease subunit [Nakamurella alba]